MTPAVLDRPTSRTPHPGLDDGVTLEELLNSAFDAARTNGSTECPACDACMTYARAAAECESCGSRLS